MCAEKGLGRFLKHLATADVVAETGPDEYAPNELTKLLATTAGTGAFINW